jgi:threonine/homoserine/homoserine lactone efflux protein
MSGRHDDRSVSRLLRGDHDCRRYTWPGHVRNHFDRHLSRLSARLPCRIGVALADAVLVILALAGLVTLVQTFEWIFLVLKYAGAAYLVWLGVRTWRSSPPAGQGQGAASNGAVGPFLLGASIGLGNPKAILFHASIMPLILDLGALTLADCAAVVMVVVGVNIVVMGFYAGLSRATARFFQTERRMRMVNRVAGGAMIGAGTLIASR